MRPESFRTPFTVAGRFVELVPLARDQVDGLRAAARDPTRYRFMRYGPGSTREDVDRLLDFLFQRQADGTDLPFTVRLVADHRIVGMTRYLHIDRANDSVEIGGTWFDPEVWRTPVNTESKLLLFRHAFESERVHRVALQTDLRNERSQAAIARLGARREGILREDTLLPEGTYRSSVHYSVLAPEWPAVRLRLEEFLRRPWRPPAGPS